MMAVVRSPASRRGRPDTCTRRRTTGTGPAGGTRSLAASALVPRRQRRSGRALIREPCQLCRHPPRPLLDHRGNVPAAVRHRRDRLSPAGRVVLTGPGARPQRRLPLPGLVQDRSRQVLPAERIMRRDCRTAGAGSGKLEKAARPPTPVAPSPRRTDQMLLIVGQYRISGREEGLQAWRCGYVVRVIRCRRGIWRGGRRG
jgi:hypothetical protein